jgi:spore coat protein A, manganese oxidase
MNRRQFLQLAAAAPALHAGSAALDPNTLERFVDPLPVPPVLRSSAWRPVPGRPTERARFFQLDMRAAEVRLHRDLPPTKLWTYGGHFPGPTIEIESGEGALIEWSNHLPESHFLPIDHTLHGAGASLPEVRTVVHVHGAKAPPESDGYPENWQTPGQSVRSFYPNRQEAAALWYHDHAMGITRLNIYAGLFGFYLIRDREEAALPLPRGPYEIPLAICDRLLRRDGQLDYPVSGKPDAPWVPEAFGNAMLVNGKLFPYLDVEPRRYRFRILNVANGRFFHLSLDNGQPFHWIGCDQGLVNAPSAVHSFVLAPAERADVILDFHRYAGQQIVLRSDAFPLMQFRVSPRRVEDTSSIPAVLRPVERIPESAASRTRWLTIDEMVDRAGETACMLLNRTHWHEPVTEKPLLDSTEIWSLVNATDDSHPIHLHLVRFQVLDRRPFHRLTYQTTGQIRYTGPAVPPEVTESGWKDTVRAHSDMVTRFIIRFEGYPGRYVWHCHVLEHEDNDMMRPYEVIAG